MNITRYNASDAPQTSGGYSQAVAVSDAKRWLYISGQIPIDSNGVVPTEFGDQCQLVWRNIEAQLRAAGMSIENLVKVTHFLSDRKYTDEYRVIRQEVLGSHHVALTTIITGIFDTDWLLEIEAIAAE